MAKTVVMDHPLIQHKIGIIRKRRNRNKGFQTVNKRNSNAYDL